MLCPAGWFLGQRDSWSSLVLQGRSYVSIHDLALTTVFLRAGQIAVREGKGCLGDCCFNDSPSLPSLELQGLWHICLWCGFGELQTLKPWLRAQWQPPTFSGLQNSCEVLVFRLQGREKLGFPVLEITVHCDSWLFLKISFILKIKLSLIANRANYLQSSSYELNKCFCRYLFPAVGCLR